MSALTSLLVTLLNFIQVNLWWILPGLIIYIVVVRGGFSKLFEWVTKVSPLTGVVGLAMVVITVIAIMRPQIFTFLADSNVGPFAPQRQAVQARVKVVKYALDPGDNPDTWTSAPARAAAGAVKSDYDLKTAKNLAGVSAAEADKLCHLPKGHLDRAYWDAAGLDPCRGSLPSGVQVALGATENLDKLEENLSQPVGTPPPGAASWVRTVYHLPQGAVTLIGLSFLMVMVGLAFRLIR